MTRLIWPDGLDEQRFVCDVWQKQPQLLQQALPEFELPIDADELAGLSLEPDASARIVTRDGHGRYQVEIGPFEEERFAELGERDWSLLVTDVEKLVPELDYLLDPFRFLPHWRIDDLMISFAPDGASVGAHIDQYDVFLLQASGTRCWQWDASHAPDQTLREGSGLKILQSFNPTHEADLQVGDILYLPPGVPHHGVALGEHCMTCSIGFRGPANSEIVQHVAERLADTLASQWWQDADIKPGQDAHIDTASLARFRQRWREATDLPDSTLNQLAGQILTQGHTIHDPARLDYSLDDAEDDVVANASASAAGSGLDGPRLDTANVLPDKGELTLVRNPYSHFAYTVTTTDGLCTLFVDGQIFEALPVASVTALCDGPPRHTLILQETAPGFRQALHRLIQSNALLVERD